MRSVRGRINLLLAAILGGALLGGSVSFFSGSKYLELQAELRTSYEIVATIAMPDGQLSERLSNLHLEPSSRESGIHGLIAGLGNKSPEWLHKQQKMILINERNFQNFIQPQIEFEKNRFLYVMSLTLFGALTLLVTLQIFVRKNIVDRVQALNHRMEEFLNNRFSYEFHTPAADEIGDLQSTFNTLAQRVIENVQEFQSLDSAKSEFLSIASHELRTPMTSIKGSLALLSSSVFGALDPQSLRLVQIAEVETDRLIRLINDLLDLAKIEARKLPLQEKWVNVDAVLLKSTQALLGLQQTAGIDITILPVPPVAAFIDNDRIHQVITNLLSNAIKFSPKAGRVRVACTVQPQGLLIEISDEGRGIAPEDRERIFQKFRQATSPESPLVKGTGLGLTIAKALVEEHGGTIGVKSEPGHGSCFYFNLPKWQWLAQAQDQTKQDIAA